MFETRSIDARSRGSGEAALRLRCGSIDKQRRHGSARPKHLLEQRGRLESSPVAPLRRLPLRACGVRPDCQLLILPVHRHRGRAHTGGLSAEDESVVVLSLSDSDRESARSPYSCARVFSLQFFPGNSALERSQPPQHRTDDNQTHRSEIVVEIDSVESRLRGDQFQISSLFWASCRAASRTKTKRGPSRGANQSRSSTIPREISRLVPSPHSDKMGCLSYRAEHLATFNHVYLDGMISLTAAEWTA